MEREHNGFHWNFQTIYESRNCGTVGCALGMGVHLGLLTAPPAAHDAYFDENIWLEAEAVFGLSDDEVDNIFANIATDEDTYGDAFYGVNDFAVTPAMVAAQLRRIAAEKMGENGGG